MVDVLRRHLDEERLFMTSGVKEEVDRIRDNLDCGTEFGSTINIQSLDAAIVGKDLVRDDRAEQIEEPNKGCDSSA